ncbi:Uncharacterized protein FKW44_007008, partial [Caligus rogercresseyi]
SWHWLIIEVTLQFNDCFNLRSDLRTVQRIRKKLEDTWDVDVTIKRAYKEEGPAPSIYRAYNPD